MAHSSEKKLNRVHFEASKTTWIRLDDGEDIPAKIMVGKSKTSDDEPVTDSHGNLYDIFCGTGSNYLAKKTRLPAPPTTILLYDIHNPSSRNDRCRPCQKNVSPLMGADSAVDSNGVSSGPFGIAVHFHEAEEAVVKYRIVDSSSMSGITNRLVHLLGMAINHNNGAFEKHDPTANHASTILQDYIGNPSSKSDRYLCRKDVPALMSADSSGGFERGLRKAFRDWCSLS
ncbi:hypothetical protein BZA05DRAFT_463546 [Tricharina praecox]|uniref:uncharacterized protein n=1 Tax=Tricharina praecox TaxID=43433 RepID=UPI002220C2DD|nr:uncharacterized protein BZA05DRAFT_463546 [Tricharina praecox]KAI5856363.1 hypothetical protein BZA05DRAFT_463546 [Tricharina praecox]